MDGWLILWPCFPGNKWHILFANSHIEMLIIPSNFRAGDTIWANGCRSEFSKSREWWWRERCFLAFGDREKRESQYHADNAYETESGYRHHFFHWTVQTNKDNKTNKWRHYWHNNNSRTVLLNVTKRSREKQNNISFDENANVTTV